MEVHYCKMDSYSEVLEINDDQYKATMKLRVLDTSKSSLHSDFVKWLKSTNK